METLSDPDHVRRSARFAGAKLFSRWYNDLRGGKHVVVVVVKEPDARAQHWIITAYMAKRLTEEELVRRGGD